MLRVDFVTLFPEMVLPAIRHSMMKRAEESGLVAFGAVNPREFTHDKHRTVDDDPFGGGPGMVMKCEPVWAAVESVLGRLEGWRGGGEVVGTEGQRDEGTEGRRDGKTEGHRDEGTEGRRDRGTEGHRDEGTEGRRDGKAEGKRGEGTEGTEGFSDLILGNRNPQSAIRNPQSKAAIVLPDPTGRLFRQSDAQELAEMDHVVLLCGHYEGIDDRIRQLLATHVFSMGDYVLTGGELPALTIADAVVRLIPGVLGCSGSLGQDSFSDGLLSAPQFTHPEVFLGVGVPEVLRSGDHVAAAAWKRLQSLRTTRQNRADLFWHATLEKKDADMLSS